jgi:hypothetical protein
MTYFIFLKYLRNLEEFRKNPHVKIPPKSPCANFQSLGIFKKSNFIRKRIFLTFGPTGPAASRPIRSFDPAAALFFLSNWPFPPLPLGLSLSAGPAHFTAQRPSSSSSPRRPSAASRLARPPHPRCHAPSFSARSPLLPPLNCSHYPH